jgi:hypothetical protein
LVEFQEISLQSNESQEENLKRIQLVGLQLIIQEKDDNLALYKLHPISFVKIRKTLVLRMLGSLKAYPLNHLLPIQRWLKQRVEELQATLDLKTLLSMTVQLL